MSGFENDSIFWIEIDRIKPNPYQPRRAFDEAKLSDLAESIRQYGILQPLVATRHEEMSEDRGLSTTYELIAGERRLRAAKIAGLSQVPLTIRSGEEQGRMKLELAIIENIQREDLNAIDRAVAFQRLVKEFKFKHREIAKKVGKSREYVANTVRLLSLPQEIQDSLSRGEITEGHARPIMMLSDKPEEQNVLFKEVILKKLTVREAEAIARRTAQDKLRKKSKLLSPEILELEKQLTETLGTRVHIEHREVGGKILIDFFSDEDLHSLSNRLASETEEKKGFLDRLIQLGPKEEEQEEREESPSQNVAEEIEKKESDVSSGKSEVETEDLYSTKNFSI